MKGLESRCQMSCENKVLWKVFGRALERVMWKITPEEHYKYHKHNLNCEVSKLATCIIHETEEKSMQIVALKPLIFKQIGNFFNSW